jgi:trehalose 6-phosphate phosphatase
MMRHILAGAHRDVLQQFAWSNVLLAFDYDGTLAPIVRDPEDANMRTSTRALLEGLGRLYPCVVVSGRTRWDTARHVQGIGLAEVIGNHGIEPWLVSDSARRAVRRWRPILGRKLAGLQGVSIENKALSIAIHYRKSREKKKARAAIREAVAALGAVRLLGGKQVANLLPPGAPHKGVAVEEARDRFGCDTAIYVGDDATDEDVFALDQPGQLLTIRVGRKRDSQAAYYVRTQREIDALLRRLLTLGARRQARLQGGNGR